MITLNVNGAAHEVDAAATDTLATVLRERLFLTGVRVSCAEGECGSCTVLIDGRATTSCLVLAHQAQGKQIVTIEGLGTPDALHPIQEAFIEEQGFQCGFCTPGFVISAKAFLDEHPDPTEQQAAIAMSGNICRCGAYPYIVKAVLNAADRLAARDGAAPVGPEVSR